MLPQRHDQLVNAYKAGTLPRPDIQWHQNLQDIDLSLQPDKLHLKLVAEGLSILPNVRLKTLVSRMREADAAIFRRKKLYEHAGDHQTSRALDLWLQGEKLIPPTILIFDQPFMDLVCRHGIPSTELQPVDGKHRLSICCYFGIHAIPILVLERQLDQIKRILK
jgi:ParB-like chromosome segregation protein Spo0J